MKGEMIKLLDYLDRRLYATTQEISRALKISGQRVHTLVSTNRRQFIQGKTEERIWTSKEGYTLEETRESIVHEAKMRGRLIGGLIVNSIPVFRSCRAIAVVDFKAISLEFGSKIKSYKKQGLLIERKEK